MVKEDNYFKSADNKTDIHYIVWEDTDNEIKGIVQLVHGMCEYIDRYDEFAAYLTRHGYAVIGHDHLGHGQSVLSKERLGFFNEENGLDILQKDIRSVSEIAIDRWPDKKLIILGHSMGSFMVRRYVTQNADILSGAVFMGTGWIPSFAAALGYNMSTNIVKKQGQFVRSAKLTNLVLGRNNRAFEPARTPVDWLSRNEDNVDKYIEDELCGFEFCAQAYVDFFKCLMLLARGDDEENINRDMPILIIAGEEDPVGGKSGCMKTYRHYRRIGIKDVTLRLFPSDRHEILNEKDAVKVFEYLVAWFDLRVKN